MAFDLGSVGSNSEMNKIYCSTAGFSNDGVKDFASHGDSVDGPWTVAVDMVIPNDNDKDKDLRGSKLEFEVTQEGRG